MTLTPPKTPISRLNSVFSVVNDCLFTSPLILFSFITEKSPLRADRCRRSPRNPPHAAGGCHACLRRVARFLRSMSAQSLKFSYIIHKRSLETSLLFLYHGGCKPDMHSACGFMAGPSSAIVRFSGLAVSIQRLSSCRNFFARTFIVVVMPEFLCSGFAKRSSTVIFCSSLCLRR